MQKFFKISLVVSFAVNLLFILFFVKVNPMWTEGQMSWTDLYSTDAEATVKFLDENFGVKEVPSPGAMPGVDYRVIKAEKGVFPYAGVMQIAEPFEKMGLKPGSTIYLTVKDYDETHAKLIRNGAKPMVANEVIAGMKFGVYVIPGGLSIGIAQYGVKEK